MASGAMPQPMREPETRAGGWSNMTTKASKTVSDYRERAHRVREVASMATSASVRRALLNVAARYDEIADSTAGTARHKRTKRATR